MTSDSMPLAPRSPWLSLALLLTTCALGVAVRFAHVGLPFFVVKYGGSMLWALAIYWFVSALLQWWRLPAVVLLTGAIATAVEFGKLCHWPWLESFRSTLAGVLLLGRYFSFRDIAAYWLAICAGALIDWIIRRRAAGEA
jgi:hypothetical protein